MEVKQTIKFLTASRTLAERFPPVPTVASLPSWWKDMPATSDGCPVKPHNATLKRCPGVLDWFQWGWTVPLWDDVAITIEDNAVVHWSSPQKDMLSFFDPPIVQGMPMPRASHPSVFKFATPWLVKCPPGVSFAVVPLAYQPNQNFTVLPGVVEGDRLHVLNILAIWHATQEVVMEPGLPMCQVIPFRRTGFKYEVEVVSGEEWHYLNQQGKGGVSNNRIVAGGYRAHGRGAKARASSSW